MPMTRRRLLSLVLLGFAVPLPARGQAETGVDRWAAVRFLLGSWDASAIVPIRAATHRAARRSSRQSDEWPDPRAVDSTSCVPVGDA